MLVDKAVHRSNTIPSSEKKICTVSSEDFLADIIRTLIYSRHILAISYVISYFIVDNTEVINHRHMQVLLDVHGVLTYSNVFRQYWKNR